MEHTKIAIVEDEPANREQIEKYLNKFFGDDDIEIEISSFHSAEDFLETLEKRRYDVVFMDIELTGIDGISAAKQLRRCDEQAILVFITNIAHMAIRGYEVSALDFIVKPIIYEDFSFKLQRIRTLLLKRGAMRIKRIKMDTSSGLRMIAAEDILYVEVVKHTVFWHLKGETIKQYASLSHIEDELIEMNFLKCNRCYLVNPAYIDEIDGFTVHISGAELQISRPQKAAFMKALNEYVQKGGG